MSRPTYAELLTLRLTRRQTLKGLAAGVALTQLGAAPPVGFAEVDHAIGDTVRVPPGYRAEVLLGWGDRVLATARPGPLTATTQAERFGYNNDFIAFHPLPGASSARGLLCVNHEYTSPSLMFEGVERDFGAALSRAQVAVEMAAHGHSVVEVRRDAGRWTVVRGPWNRRITAMTPMWLRGPAAGHPRLRTAGDPTGRLVLGTLSNCAGGTTPWGTTLIAEENFDKYFFDPGVGGPEARQRGRLGIGRLPHWPWHRHHPRFSVERTPNECNRFGWVVEYDPRDPGSVPVKRTALGRFKHECAETVLDASGRVVVYSGDDQRFECLYRFVSEGRFDPEDPAANRDLLDRGTLCAARFEADGTLRWLPLVFGEGPLIPKNGFASQADVLIDARQAAEAVGATPMDRPEDVAVDPVSGHVFVMLTNNSRRTTADAANPRTVNRFGHVLELRPPGGHGHAADTMGWGVLLLAGDPKQPGSGARYHPEVTARGWLANPDNGAFDPSGRLWISTDGAERSAQVADGLWLCPVSGPDRARTRRFLALPRGAELCGPCLTPDGKTLFVSVQHPGEGSNRAHPSVRWPDPDRPPRPAVVAITHEQGALIGA